MNSYYRYGALIIGVIVVLVIGFLPLTSVVVDQWSRRDVELRSRLVFNSIQDQIQSDILRKDDSAVSKLFDRLADDERLVGIMYCDDNDNLLIETKSLGKDVACKALARSDRPNFSTINHSGRRLYIATFPISAGDTKGHVAILHDLSFIEARAAEVRFYWVIGIVGVGLAISLLAAALMFFLLRQWLASARQTILDARKGGTLRDNNGTPTILGAEIQKLVRDLKSDATTGETPIQVDWSP